ncbi:unnamed protein product [Cladocopium goreaui]|uniref:Dynein regulatory complex subunit 3 n=1 Tax=Cladocopium goreaui TaxID=2562237 RepID=A0A9P1DSF0_9DINO|nr:unnamed protein product [Cladocopium goreaui]
MFIHFSYFSIFFHIFPYFSLLFTVIVGEEFHGFHGAHRGNRLLRSALQHRTVVARAASATKANAVRELQDEVAQKFAMAASGHPPSISTAQLVQMLFELGVADVRRQEVGCSVAILAIWDGDVLDVLMQHGFYCKTHPQKRDVPAVWEPDSYGPMAPPTVGLLEVQRWATLFFMRRMRPVSPGPRAKGIASRSAVPCAAAWCQCPKGAAGTDRCALYRWQTKMVDG